MLKRACLQVIFVQLQRTEREKLVSASSSSALLYCAKIVIVRKSCHFVIIGVAPQLAGQSSFFSVQSSALGHNIFWGEICVTVIEILEEFFSRSKEREIETKSWKGIKNWCVIRVVECVCVVLYAVCPSFREGRIHIACQRKLHLLWPFPGQQH